jgi:DNA-binding beta-propeller fold protein YncE
VLLLGVLSATVLISRGSASVVMRTVPIGGFVGAMAVDAQTGRAFAIEDGTVYVLDSGSGTLVRTRSIEPYTVGFTTIAADERTARIVVAHDDGSAAGYVHLLDARSGTPLRALPLSLAPAGMAVDAESNRAFVVGNLSNAKHSTPGVMAVVDVRKGRVVRTILLGGRALLTGAMSLDTRVHRLYVVYADPSTVPLQGNGGLIAVDERAGQAFVTTYGRRVVPPLDPWAWIPSSLRRRLPFLPAPPAPHFAAASVTMIDATQ